MNKPYSTSQLCLLRSLQRGFEKSLTAIMIRRCGAEDKEWFALRDANLIESKGSNWALSEKGKKVYKSARVGRYF